jgi:hypothetical protein
MMNHDFDVYQQRFYLTPTGWVQQQPADTSQIVEIWELDIYQPTGWSREYHDWTCMWATARTDWNPDMRDVLRERFAFPDLRRADVRSVVNIGLPINGSVTGNGMEDAGYMTA